MSKGFKVFVAVGTVLVTAVVGVVMFFKLKQW